MRIEFLKPARMDDLLEIATTPVEVKGASITLRQQIRRAHELLVEAQVRVACIAAGRARPIPRALRRAMLADQELASSSSMARQGET